MILVGSRWQLRGLLLLLSEDLEGLTVLGCANLMSFRLLGLHQSARRVLGNLRIKLIHQHILLPLDLLDLSDIPDPLILQLNEVEFDIGHSRK